MALIDELVTGPNDSKPKQSIADQLGPQAKTPGEQFAVKLMDTADRFGVLDSAFSPETVDDSFTNIEDGQDNFVPSGPEITELADLWKAIPRAERRAMESEMMKENPQFAKEFIGVMESTG